MFFVISGLFIILNVCIILAASVVSLNGDPRDGAFFCHGGGMYFLCGAALFAAGVIVCIVEIVLWFTGGFDAVLAYVVCGVSFASGLFIILPVFNCVTINEKAIKRRYFFGLKRTYTWDSVSLVKIYKGHTRMSADWRCWDWCRSEIVKIYVNGRRVVKIDEDYTDFEPLTEFIRKMNIPLDDWKEKAARRAAVKERRLKEKRLKKTREEWLKNHPSRKN